MNKLSDSSLGLTVDIVDDVLTLFQHGHPIGYIDISHALLSGCAPATLASLKVRARRIDNGEWVYGYYQHVSDSIGEYHWVHDTFGDIHSVDPATVQQCLPVLPLTSSGSCACSGGAPVGPVSGDLMRPLPGHPAWLEQPWATRGCKPEAVLEEIRTLKELLLEDFIQQNNVEQDPTLDYDYDYQPYLSTAVIIDRWLALNRVSILDVLDDAYYAYLNDQKLK